MTCHNCKTQCKRFGRNRRGHQRFQCRQCSKTFTKPHNGHFFSMYTPTEKAVQVLQLLVEGMSVRSVERITGVHRDTILRVLIQAGQRCEKLLEQKIQNVPVSDVQCDEIWGYIGCKEKNNVDGDPTRGDAYCFVALERHSKLILTWHLGRRTGRDTQVFIDKLSEAAQGHFQLTTDGYGAYIDAVHFSLWNRVDFAQLVKVYKTPREGMQRYSPAEVVECVPVPRWGKPKLKRICTSHVERQNLTLRMQIRRLTRLTNAFSKKWENLKAALALHFAWYNFCRIHSALRFTPAMEAGLTDHIWALGEVMGLTQI